MTARPPVSNCTVASAPAFTEASRVTGLVTPTITFRRGAASPAMAMLMYGFTEMHWVSPKQMPSKPSRSVWRAISATPPAVLLEKMKNSTVILPFQVPAILAPLAARYHPYDRLRGEVQLI
jgi:hypothetical protein